MMRLNESTIASAGSAAPCYRTFPHKQSTMNPRVLTLALAVTLLSVSPSKADVVAVFFTGFNPDNPSGMDGLSDFLTNQFNSQLPSQSFSSMVFAYNDQQTAQNYINSFGDIDHLFLGGHSWGGFSAIELAETLATDDGINVDITFQIDSIRPPLGGAQEVPASVGTGYNYYQVSTGGIFEPQGAMNVLNAININVEDLFNDTSITHTSIDNDVRLYNVIYNTMAAAVPEPSLFSVTGLALLIGCCRRRTRKRQVGQAASAAAECQPSAS